MASSSSLSRTWEHDVFPSFHGPDVRTTFLSHTLKEFRNKGIDTFIDNGIKRGESIGPELKRAIRGSKIAIVLLSEKYASSSWCLDELVEIINCREELGQTVMTIFYKVNPTDVKKQIGDFGKVFKETCQGKTKEKIETWTKALEGVATIAGYHLTNWDDEAAMIEGIAAEILNILNIATRSRDSDRYIGMGGHMKRLESILRLNSEEVKMIGIWGPPGIGKRTIARCLFNQFSSSFQLSAIMVNIKGSYPRPCLDEGTEQLKLQGQMLSQMLHHKDMVITHLGVAQEMLKGKKVFLVLDDVDRLAQLRALAEKNQWFGLGSRIVITTEDQRVLKAHGINDIDIYKVDYPTPNEAFQMFCKYAFGQEYPKDGFTELAWKVTKLVGELPLGLQVMGSHFRGMSEDEWTNTLPSLRRQLDSKIESILQFSYDALDDADKDLFLHIAGFFHFLSIEQVVEYFKKRYPDVRQRLFVLHEKSLISIEYGRVMMHDLLVQLGRDIDRKHGQGRFLKIQELEDIPEELITEELIDDAAARRSLIGIHIIREHNILNINERAFEGMSNLQLLKVTGCQSHGLSYLPPNIRFLDWHGFPMTRLPSSLNVESLVGLDMCSSNLEKLWKGNKSLRNLKWMNLRSSRNLKKLPNLSTAINLESLQLCSCSSLIELPSSIENVTNLQTLDLSFCSSLMKLPSSIGNATNLQTLDLKYCSSFKLFPEMSINISCIDLSGTAIEELPSSIRTWYHLDRLKLKECKKLVSLPQLPKSVSYLNAANCKSLERLDCSFRNFDMHLKFGNCFKLNKDARDLIIQTSSRYSRTQVLPGKEIPICFTHRANGGSLILKFTERHFPSTLKFKACILLGRKNDIEDEHSYYGGSEIMVKHSSSEVLDRRKIGYPLTEHLYIFETEADVSSHEHVFDFLVRSDEWGIKECGVNYGDCEAEEEINEGDSDSAETKKRKNGPKWRYFGCC